MSERVFILGAGRAGRGLSRALRASGIAVTGLHGRRAEGGAEKVTAGALPDAARQAQVVIVAVRDSQIGFYRRRFGMEILSGAERWPGLATPRVLMGLPWREHAGSLLRRIPTLVMTPEEQAELAAEP